MPQGLAVKKLQELEKLNNTFNGTVQRVPYQSHDFTYRKIPDEIARELESEDELYFWSPDGTTLISSDGTKTIPSSMTTQKDESPQVNCFDDKAYVNQGSLGLILSSVNLILLLWFWATNW